MNCERVFKKIHRPCDIDEWQSKSRRLIHRVPPPQKKKTRVSRFPAKRELRRFSDKSVDQGSCEINQLRLERSVVSARLTSCTIPETCESHRPALTAIFRQRAARRAIRAKRVIALDAKPPVSGAAFTFSRASTDRGGIALQVPVHLQATRPDQREAQILRQLFYKLLNARFHQLSTRPVSSIKPLTILNCSLFCQIIKKYKVVYYVWRVKC